MAEEIQTNLSTTNLPIQISNKLFNLTHKNNACTAVHYDLETCIFSILQGILIRQMGWGYDESGWMSNADYFSDVSQQNSMFTLHFI